jgi:hypothetical protein
MHQYNKYYAYHAFPVMLWGRKEGSKSINGTKTLKIQVYTSTGKVTYKYSHRLIKKTYKKFDTRLNILVNCYSNSWSTGPCSGCDAQQIKCNTSH